MPKRDVILNFPGFTVVKASGYDPVVLDLVYRRKVRCIHCDGREIRKKSSFMREVRHETMDIGKRYCDLKAISIIARNVAAILMNNFQE